jgi:hypothetical protein
MKSINYTKVITMISLALVFSVKVLMASSDGCISHSNSHLIKAHDEQINPISICSITNENGILWWFYAETELTNDEIQSLRKMKEEEKLAHDVYSALFEKWEIPVLRNIMRAERNHINAILYTMKLNNIGDTLLSEKGIFTDPEIQALYTELVNQGTKSIADAYATGALIEEMDIHDLQQALLSAQDDHLIRVFSNLKRASETHLRAFNAHIEGAGNVYTPVYISEGEFKNIIGNKP